MVEKQWAKLRQLFGVALIFLLAPSMNAETTPGLSTGIEGTVTISPTHGGPIREDEPASASMKNISFLVETAAGKVATSKTDDQGNFKLPLPPGRYSITIPGVGIKGRGCGLADIEVTTPGFKKVTINCDSGMR
jgi:hypothetical protein